MMVPARPESARQAGSGDGDLTMRMIMAMAQTGSAARAVRLELAGITIIIFLRVAQP
jgi:hypothetical protein